MITFDAKKQGSETKYHQYEIQNWRQKIFPVWKMYPRLKYPNQHLISCLSYEIQNSCQLTTKEYHSHQNISKKIKYLLLCLKLKCFFDSLLIALWFDEKISSFGVNLYSFRFRSSRKKTPQIQADKLSLLNPNLRNC